jgi:F0F1-type ATP synthase assembly protein I
MAEQEIEKRMKNVKKLLLALSTGYILMFYSELVFYARYRPNEDTIGSLITTWIVYSVLSYAFLSIVSVFKVRSIWALFLSGAVYGWSAEGIIVQTMYDNFPFQLSWTGLAWHDLISILIGWYIVRVILHQNNVFKTMLLAGGLGLFWGFWAISWWLDDPKQIAALPTFSIFTFATSSLLILCYCIYDRNATAAVSLNKYDLYMAATLLAPYYIFITLRAVPISALILFPLLAVVMIALIKNRKTETRSSLAESSAARVQAMSYACLLVMPLVAVAVYAAAILLDVRFHTNIIVYIITTALGVALFVISLVKIMSVKPQTPSVDTPLLRRL